MKSLKITPPILRTLVISILVISPVVNLAQTAPTIAAENGTVAVIGCTEIEVTNATIPNPAIIEWWNDHDNDPGTAALSVQTGGTIYLPTAIGHYFVTFPWHPDPSNLVEAVVFSPIGITQFPSGNITNAQTGASACGPVPGQLNPTYMTGVNYVNPIWTRNFNMFESDYNVDELWRPGDYTLKVEGPCGLETITHTVNFECDNNILNSSCGYDRTYEFGGTLSSSSIITDAIIGQTLTLTGNCIIGGHMKMEQDAIIVVTAGASLQLDGAVFTSCGTWKGIVVDGGSLVFTGTPSANLPAKIYDAEVGITIKNSSTSFIIQKAHFEDNGVHLASKNSNFDIQECMFNSLKNIPNNNSYASFLTGKQTSNPMFYAEGSTISYMDSVFFDHRDANQPGTLNTTTAMELNQTELGSNARIEIRDNFLNGIWAYDCEDLHIKGVRFGSIYVQSVINYVPLQPYSENGIYMKECKNTILDGLTISASDIGVQNYIDPPIISTTGSGSHSRFGGLTISIAGTLPEADRVGIILAPEENPLHNTNPAINNNSMPMNVDIFCSRISDGTYGILGSGKKTDWVMPSPGSGLPPGNYDPSIEFNNISDWKIIWSENVAWNVIPKMRYYTASPYSNPLVSSTTPSLLLDGTSTNNNNFRLSPNNEPFLTAIAATGVFCQPTWISYKRNPININQINTNSAIIAYPNPFNNELSLDLSSPASIKVTNVLGKQILKLNTNNSIAKINTTNWSTGIYFITITTHIGIETIQVVKQK